MNSDNQNPRIKLLIMITSFQIGGTERQLVNTVLGLDLSRFELHLACIHRRGELLREVEALDVPQPAFPIASLYKPRTFLEVFRLMRYIRKNGIQVVHSYGLYPNLITVPAARLAGASVVVASIRDRGDILSTWQRWLQRQVCRFAGCILVNAESIREALISQRYRADNISVIPNGIATSRAAAEGATGIRHELRFPPRSRVIVVVSRLNRMKGVEFFLIAAKMIVDAFPDVRFAVIGDGALKAELEGRATYLGLGGLIRFTGFRTDVPALLRDVTLSVLPSLSEGLSNTLLESMAAGVPVIATNVGGNPELVDDGVSGLLVPPRDPVGLAKAMARLLDDPVLAARLGEAGKQKITGMFSMERSVREVEALYQRLVEAPQPDLAEATV